MNPYNNITSILCILLVFSISSCTSEKKQTSINDNFTVAETQLNVPSNTVDHNSSVNWAVNIAGPEYLGFDGIKYQADTLDLAGYSGQIKTVKGTQDSFLYQTYQVGDFALAYELENGVYDLTFKFAEPTDNPVGSRIFEVFAEDKKVIDSMDVKLARDGKSNSALVRSVYDVVVDDGQLNVRFDASKGEPILSAFVVRKKYQDKRPWQLIWQDEFAQDGLPDPSKWQYDIWPARKVNDEDQAYTSRAKNARIENGHLIIEAHKEDYDNAKYTSARLNSKGSGDFLYGKAEVRAKLPAGQGSWSAIWMLPSNPFKYATNCAENADWQGNDTCDAWPNSGEIDIMEHVGYDMQTIHGTVHNKAYYWRNWQQRKGSIEGETVDTEFHLYSIEWTPNDITVFFDNVPYFYYRNELNDWRSWPFDHPYHLILNLAIGGAWGRAGGPIDNSIFPVRMEIDYVRVYQLEE